MRFLACFFVLLSFPALAQIDQNQLDMLKASQLVMTEQFPQAEQLYTQVISHDPSNAEAYLQRATLRRQMHNDSGMQADAAAVLQLSAATLARNNRDADVYLRRSRAERLLRQFPQARQDLEIAQRLKPSANAQSDLQALALEEKMAQ